MSNLAEEIGSTVRVAIRQWPQTLRLISILATVTFPITLAVLLRS